MHDAVIIDAVRTPVGRHGGALAGVRPDDMAALVIREVVRRTGINPALVEEGKVVFEDNCAACHGEDAKGMQELGAPNLTDNIWLYGGSLETVMQTVQNGRGGIMPAWAGRLDEATIKSLAVYVHSLGGGQ